ncbi:MULTISPECIES: nucleoside triphosphate pyrophosphatase [unclassified Shewanella]|uniref:Maf family protein n=1 Tax=unclassified Shewanella TaxID=196818 RepID=UPI000C7AD9D0|nr:MULTISPECIES: nucleoside triphosphate pyrophosphatase [unclassified Shewanella]PKG57686.1 septum formation inhibitor Maf [Shewanella sp. GutDb-MelDb]PKG72509.1 septum formation inhibitor Maf [Shewanella sp. GutCb]
MSKALILASTSPFRKQLLNKLNLPFSCCSPEVDETPLDNESPKDLVLRLSKLKAAAGAAKYTKGVVIGSDQVAVINNQIIGKPLNRETAIQQLSQSSGQSITFYTGLALHDVESGQVEAIVEPFIVHFRTLTPEAISRYVDTEQPFYCAGSFKCEGLGIALFERLEGKDPNTLVGLPLISLIDLLHLQGIDVL